MNARPPWPHIARASREERRRRARTHACNRAWPYARARCAAPPHHCQQLCDNLKHDVLTMYCTPNIALFLRHDPHPIPPATPRAPNFSDPPRSAPPQLSIAPERYETWQHKLPLFPQLAALFYRRSRTTRIEMNAFGLLTTRPVRHLHHTGEQRPSQRPPATCSKK